MRAAKLAVVEALVAAYDAVDDPVKPVYIGIEYPELEEQWPALLVQFRPDSQITWTGLMPDEIQALANDPQYDWTRIRAGKFSGSFEFMILALSSGERDQLWDALLAMILMADLQGSTNLLLSMVSGSDVIPMTMLHDHIQQVGDSIGGGVPWNPDLLAYEVSVRVDVTGQFYADSFTQKLVSLSGIEIHPTDDTQPLYGGGDGDGAWH